MALTQVDQGLLGQYAQYTGFKNRIINGAMMIDQRNAGAAINVASGSFPVDRYSADISGGGVVSTQRSTVAPTGFTNSIGFTVTTADTSITAGDYCYLMQSVEGYNVADFNSGTANAVTYTLSFWVRSSLIGIYTGAFVNSAQNRARTFEYTINSANTWEYKTITVTGDTTGTWLTDNGAGLRVKFALMIGSTFQQAAGSWGSTAYAGGTSNQVNWTGTVGNTFYITGVQLEKGSTATSFDYRPYGTEYALCQRYFCVSSGGTQVAQNSSYTETMFHSGCGSVFNNDDARCNIYTLPVIMRTSPTVTIIGNSLGASNQYSLYSRNGGWVAATSTSPNSKPQCIDVSITKTSGFVGIDSFVYYGGFIASAEL